MSDGDYVIVLACAVINVNDKGVKQILIPSISIQNVVYIYKNLVYIFVNVFSLQLMDFWE